jgi:hypothetical protein
MVLNSERFHSMNASIKFLNNNRVLFYSYETPMVLYNALNNEMLLRDEWFSSSTTRQVNRFIKEYAPNQVIKLKRDDFIKYLNVIGG